MNKSEKIKSGRIMENMTMIYRHIINNDAEELLICIHEYDETQ